jgi:peptide deformylase
MAIREIIYPDNPVLRKKAHRVREFNRDLHTLLDDMAQTMQEADGVGLAAPQVEVSQRAIVVRLPDGEQWVEEYGEEAGKLYEVVNPEIIRKSRETVDGVEACLSIPGYFGTVERHEAVTIRGQNRDGETIRIKARDWLARVFQHEIDHLDGVLYTDIATEIWKAGEEPIGAGENGADPSAGEAEAPLAEDAAD